MMTTKAWTEFYNSEHKLHKWWQLFWLGHKDKLFGQTSLTITLNLGFLFQSLEEPKSFGNYASSFRLGTNCHNSNLLCNMHHPFCFNSNLSNHKILGWLILRRFEGSRCSSPAQTCAATRFCFKVSEKAAVTSGGKQYWGSLKRGFELEKCRIRGESFYQWWLPRIKGVRTKPNPTVDWMSRLTLIGSCMQQLLIKVNVNVQCADEVEFLFQSRCL